MSAPRRRSRPCVGLLHPQPRPPLSFARRDGQVDVLVGNPPWLAYRHMPERIQIAYRQLAEARGLWAGGKVATHQDLIFGPLHRFRAAGGLVAAVEHVGDVVDLLRPRSGVPSGGP